MPAVAVTELTIESMIACMTANLIQQVKYVGLDFAMLTAALSPV